MTAAEPVVFKCQCGLTYATLDGEHLWIKSRHWGNQHLNGIPIRLLARLANGEPVTEEQLRPVLVVLEGEPEAETL